MDAMSVYKKSDNENVSSSGNGIASRGTAVQVVNMKTLPAGGSQFVFEKAAFCHILKDVGDRPIHLLSIAGASRQGKSFLMNVIRSFLEEMEKGAASPWTNIAQMEKLEGFHIENRNVRDTIGFWLWSKPFIFKQTSGKEIAVLLMDTQGVFDKYTSKKEWSMIVGLSLLTSSCVIYNLMNNLLEDNLEIFNNFVQFGMLTLKEDKSATSAFHKLLFLIRDWGFPNDNAYGPTGGSQFINNHLKVLPEMPKDLQEIRRTLRTVFQEIECFLMPHPGSPAKQNDFEGSLRNLDPEFLRNLEVFLNNLFIVDDLRPLTIGGRQVHGKDLPKYFSNYIDLLNRQNLPNASSLFDTTREAELQAVTEEYVAAVVQQTEKLIAEKGFLSDAQLKQEYEKICKFVMARFTEMNHDEPPQLLSKFKDMLFRQLKQLFPKFSKENLEGKDNYVSRLLDSSISAYKRKVEEASRGVVHSLKDMEIILASCREEVTRGLDFGSRDESFLKEVYEKLQTALNSIHSSYAQNNEIQLQTLQTKCRSCFEDLSKEYEKNMSMFFSDEDLKTVKPDKLASVHKNYEDDIVQKFRRLVVFNNPNLEEEAINELKSTTTMSITKRLEFVKKFQSSKSSSAMHLVQQAIDKYCLQMNTYLQENNLSDKEISNKDMALKLEAKEVMFQLFSILGANEAASMKEVLDSKLAESYEGFKNEVQVRKEQFKSQWEYEVQQAALTHEMEVKTYVEKLPHPSEEAFTQFLETSQRNMVAAAGDASWLSKDHQGQLRNEVHQRLKQLQETLWNFYKSTIRKAVDECSKETHRWAENYSTKLQEVTGKAGETLTIQKLNDIHTKLSGEFSSDFHSRWVKILPQTLLKESTKQLQSKLNPAYSELSESLKTNILERISDIEQIILECCESYVSEMEEKLDDNSDLAKFERFHNISKTRAEREFNRQTKSFSSFPQMPEMKKKFLAEVDQAYQQKLETLHQNQQHLEADVAMIHQESVDNYRKEFARRRPTFSNEGDIRPVHLELMTIAVKNLELKFSRYEAISIQRLFCEKIALESILEKELTKQTEEWNSFNNAIDEKTKLAMQEIMNAYQNHMNEVLVKSSFLSAGALRSIHENLLQRGTEKMRRTNKPPGADPKVYENQLEQELCNIFACFSNENASKRHEVERQISERVQGMKEEFSKWLSSQRSPQGQWDTQIANYLQQIINFCSKFNLAEDAKQELHKTCEEEITSAFNTVKGDWEKLEPTESELELAVLKCREIYEKEMDSKITPDSPLLHMRQLKLIHKSSVAKAMNDFEKMVKQTTLAKERMHASLEVAFVRYQDENDVKAADAGHIAVGIDLGTTYSCVAVYRQKKLEIIPDRNNHKDTVPSYVLFETKDNVVVGESAKEQSVIYPHTTVFDSKRLIGRRFNDKEVTEDIKLWPFRVINDNNRPKVVVHEESFFPEEISGKILTQLKTNAEQHLGHEVKRAVITVPAYFSDAQKRATRAAADFAGLEVLELLSEPTAAAIAYNFHYNDDKKRNVFVYDLGGGTFDVSILASEKGKMEVKAIGGNNHLGGQDFDNAMVKYCYAEFNKKHNMYLENEGDQREKDARVRRIRNRCEIAKINLSKSEKVRVINDRLYLDKDMDVEITREEFNKMIDPMLRETIAVSTGALTSAGLTPEDISDVVLVGGSSRIPRAQELLKELFKRDRLNMALNPDEVVARGAAYRAAMLSGAKDRELSNIKFNNVTPFALGTATVGDKLSIILEKNSLLPCKKTEHYTTSANNQTVIKVSVFEGENPVASKNNLLAEFCLKDIPAAPAGKEPIDITMELDDEGLLSVAAVCKSTGGTQDIQIDTLRAGLSQEEIANAKAAHK